jgi:hypothetical protein
MPIRETERERAERVLNELLAEAHAAQGEVEKSRDSLLSGLFSDAREKEPENHETPPRLGAQSDPEWPQPPKAQFPKPGAKAERRSDLVVAALGVTLGLICALFPWYIFYNDVRFTTHGFYLGGKGERGGRIVNPNPAMGSIASETTQDTVPQNLDLFATGTPAEEREDPDDAPGLDQQPFPAENTDFQLVHVANGRAMIEDDAGLWIVQPGSTLPDSSTLTSIEKRNGKWVLVTSTNAVIGMTR